MELPPYRLPTVKGLAIHVWERAWQYIKKAGTIILGFAIIMWFLMSYPHIPEAHLTGLSDVQAAEQAAAYTFAGRMGKTIEPVLRPLGFNWKVGIALIAGFGAKEVVVSTLATAYSLEGEDEEAPDLRAALVNDPDFSPLVAYTLMIFVLIYIPCMAAVAVIYREANSWKWPLFAIVYTTTLAWIVSFIVFNLGKLLGYG
jgi:ferrous iron transport protein B